MKVASNIDYKKVAEQQNKLRESLKQTGQIDGAISKELQDGSKQASNTENKKVTLDQAGKAVKKSFLWGLGIGALITVIIYKIRS